MINALRKMTQKNIMLEDLYNHPTLALFSARVETIKEPIQASIYPSQSDTSVKNPKLIPLSDMQLLFWIMEHLSSKLKVPNIIKRVRLKGKIDKHRLDHAFLAVLKRHEILNYRSSFFPIQYLQQNSRWNVVEQDISSHPYNEQLKILHDSLNYLQNKLRWKKGNALLTARLYFLDKNTCELQIALAHTIADDISLSIILDDLSYFYSQSDLTLDPSYPSTVPFKEHIQLERNGLATVDRDIPFWEDYLSDGSHIRFPKEDRVSLKSDASVSTTSYFPIKEMTVNRMLDLANKFHVSIADVICSLVALSIRHYKASHSANSILINLVKSTRDNELYDHTVGLFIRNDLIKVPLSANKDVLTLASTLKQGRMNTAPYQFCPGMIKLASSLKEDWEKKKVSNILINSIAWLLSKIFPASQLHPKVLSCYGKVLVARNNDFIINVNILNGFLSPKNDDKKLFGFEPIELEPFYNERIAAQNVLDISFDRDDSSKHFLIICSNIQPDLRKQIGNQIISTIENQLLKIR